MTAILGVVVGVILTLVWDACWDANARSGVEQRRRARGALFASLRQQPGTEGDLRARLYGVVPQAEVRFVELRRLDGSAIIAKVDGPLWWWHRRRVRQVFDSNRSIGIRLYVEFRRRRP